MRTMRVTMLAIITIIGTVVASSSPPPPPPSTVVSWRSTYVYWRDADRSTYRRLVDANYDQTIRRTLPRGAQSALSKRYNLMTYDGMSRIFNNCTIRFAVDPSNAAGAATTISLRLYFGLREWNATDRSPVTDRELYRHANQWGYYDADLHRNGRYDTHGASRLRDILDSVYARYESAIDFDEHEMSQIRDEYRPHPRDGYVLDLTLDGNADILDAPVRQRIVAELTAAQLRHWFPRNSLEEVRGGNADASRILREYDRRCSLPDEIDLIVSFEPQDHRPVCATKLGDGVLAHASFSYLHLREDTTWTVAYSHLSGPMRREIRERIVAANHGGSGRAITPERSGVKPYDVFLEHVLLHELGHFYGLQHKYSEHSEEDIRWREKYRPYSIMYPSLASQFLHISLGRYDSMMVAEIDREIAFWRDATTRLYDTLLARCRTDTYDGVLFVLRLQRLRESMARARYEIEFGGAHMWERIVTDMPCSTVERL